MQQLAIPEAALPFILFQRTQYLWHTKTLAYRLLKRLRLAPSYRTTVRWESALRQREIRRIYNRDMVDEYLSIESALPSQAKEILDVGCGLGGIDVLLDRHYGSPADLTFHLLDRTHVEDEIFYMFHRRGAFYNSLALTRRFLVANGVSDSRLQTYEATDDNRIAVDRPLDLVISLISWGFHYPVDVYLEQVAALMRPGAPLIIDLREGTDGHSRLTTCFSQIEVLQRGKKHVRVCAVR